MFLLHAADSEHMSKVQQTTNYKLNIMKVCNIVTKPVGQKTEVKTGSQGSSRDGKEEKYVDLGAHYIFEPIAVESLGVVNASARHLQDDLGRRISENSCEARGTSFLYKRVSILVQRFNARLERPPFAQLMIIPNFVFSCKFFKVLGVKYVLRVKNIE